MENFENIKNYKSTDRQNWLNNQGDNYKSEYIPTKSPSILRLPQVIRRSGLPKSTIYELIKNGLWTHSVLLVRRSVGWPENEVDSLITAMIAGKTPEQIRTLVVKLEAFRQCPS